MTRIILGTIAGTLTTISFIPQVVKVYKTKNAKDLSMVTFLLFSCGVLCWLLYGIYIKEWPIIAANGITLVLALSIIVMKIRFR